MAVEKFCFFLIPSNSAQYAQGTIHFNVQPKQQPKTNICWYQLSCDVVTLWRCMLCCAVMCCVCSNTKSAPNIDSICVCAVFWLYQHHLSYGCAYIATQFASNMVPMCRNEYFAWVYAHTILHKTITFTHIHDTKHSKCCAIVSPNTAAKLIIPYTYTCIPTELREKQVFSVAHSNKQQKELSGKIR